MSAAFGVHFGGTSACLAVFKDGKTEVVANDAGDRTTPAVVAFTDHDQSVGLAAKQGIIRNAANTVCNAKKLIGVSYDDPEIEKLISSSTVKVVNKDGKPVYEVDYKEKKTNFSPQQIVSVILKTLLEIAQRHGDEDDTHDAVLTVPLHFTENQKTELRKAAEKAGFCVLRIISEPSAAVLAYGIGQTTPQENCNVLVYRLGGTSLDATVVRVDSGMYRVLSSVCQQTVGGKDCTELLVQHFAAEFQRQWKADIRENKRSMSKLRSASEVCKHILATMPSAQCSVESLFEGIDFQGNISRARFDGLCSGLIQNFLKPLEEVLERSDLARTDIDKVILCGGSTKMPIVQQQVQDYFPKAQLLSRIVPDEVLAVGAAKQAAVLVGDEEEELLLNEKENEIPCVPADISIETLQEGEPHYLPIFTKMTPVPVRRTHSFTLDCDQTSFAMNILVSQGTTKPASVAKLCMTDLPAGCKVNTVFHIRSDGSMHVTSSEPTSNKSQDVLIEGS